MNENPSNSTTLNRLNKLEKKIQEYEEALDKANSVLRALQGTIAELKQLKSDLDILKQSNEVLTSTISDLNQKTESHGQKINLLLSQLEERFTILRNELEALKTVGMEQSSRPASEQATPSLDEFKKELEDIVEKLNHSITEQESLKQRMDELTTLHQELSAKSENISEKMRNELMSQASSIKTDILSKTDDKIMALEEKVREQLVTLESKLLEQEQQLSKINDLDEIKASLGDLSQRTAQESAKYEEKLQEVLASNQHLQERVNSVLSEFNSIKDSLEILKNQLTQVQAALSAFERRVERIESHLGFTVTKELSAGEDSKSLLRSLVANMLGEQKVDKYDLNDPAKVVESLIDLSLHISCAVDRSGLIDVAELVLKYAGDDDSSGPMNETIIIQNYRGELIRTLEIGEAVLMELGRQRTVTRQIMQDTKNIVRSWVKKEDVQDQFPKVLELLNFLKEQYEATGE